jgi:glycosyltransferase A (GT-A) superfamily protein (DUF2064 family)
MPARVLVLTKLPFALPVKTRLWPLLGEAGAARLYTEMVYATFATARAFDATPTLAYSPPDADPSRAFPDLGPHRALPLRATDGPSCLAEAIERTWDGAPLIVLGGDAPDLPRERIDAGLAALDGGAHGAAVVPTPDGGFSCLVLARPIDGFASAFRFGASDSRTRLVEWLAAHGCSTAMLEPWPDVDTEADLAAYQRRRLTDRRAAP